MWLFKKMSPKGPKPEVQLMQPTIEQAGSGIIQHKCHSATALSGAKTRERLISFVEQVESEIHQYAIAYVEKEGVLMVHPRLLETIRDQPDAFILEPDLYLAFPTPDAARRVNDEWQSTIKKYLDRNNGTELLREKGLILSTFVVYNICTGITIYNETHDDGQKLSDEKEAIARFEEAALWHRIIDELAYRYIFEERLLYNLTLQGASPDFVADLFRDRSCEYVRYQKWVPEGKEDEVVGTLLWEAAKHVGNTFGEGRNAIFLHTFIARFLDRVSAAMVCNLLTGR
jgi:hypothetical protein